MCLSVTSAFFSTFILFRYDIISLFLLIRFGHCSIHSLFSSVGTRTKEIQDITRVNFKKNLWDLNDILSWPDLLNSIIYFWYNTYTLIKKKLWNWNDKFYFLHCGLWLVYFFYIYRKSISISLFVHSGIKLK